MTEEGFRAGPARDVPPPRPVPSAPAAGPAPETGLGRAARAVADAVGGMIGGGDPGSPAAERRRATAAGLREVIGAVAGAVGAAFVPGRDGAPPPSPAAAAGSAASDRAPGALLGDLLSAVAPGLPIRTAERLREAHPGASDTDIADALVARAARMTSGIGAAAGGLSAAHWIAPPSLLAVPLELGAETVLTAAVEVVLIGELHELHGRPAPGDARDRAAAYLAGWSARRSVDVAGSGLGSLLGTAGVRALRRQVTRRLAGSAASAAPLMIGAAISSRLNRHATESLAARVLADLRADRPPV